MKYLVVIDRRRAITLPIFLICRDVWRPGNTRRDHEQYQESN